MRRTQIYLDEGQATALDRRARAVGRTRSDVIREAISGYLDRDDDERAALRRFHEAVDEAAGCAPYLPPGDEYVRELRKSDARRQERLEKQWRG